jgi:hypothetical protein
LTNYQSVKSPSIPLYKGGRCDFPLYLKEG